MNLMQTIAVALAAVMTVGSVVLSGRQAAASVEIGWLGLYNPQLFQWLDNKGRLPELCGMPVGTAQWQRCRTEKLAPWRLSIRLRSGPSEQAAAVGSLLLVATPGGTLRSFFVPAGNRTAIQFQPDQYDPDWGYGPYFHETFLERRGTWFRLPEVPFPKSTWIDARRLGDTPSVLLIESEKILTSPFGSLFVLGIDENMLRARREQEPDMWCDGREPPALKPWRERRIPLRDLYTKTGHLKLQVKYTRGC